MKPRILWAALAASALLLAVSCGTGLVRSAAAARLLGIVGAGSRLGEFGALSPATETAEPPTLTPGPAIGGEPSQTPSPVPTPTLTPIAYAVWAGPPTYPGDSEPGIFFRLLYDPDSWTLLQENDLQRLTHIRLPGCVMTPIGGRGLPPTWKVDFALRLIGPVSYEVYTVYLRDELQFVSYAGGDMRIYTSFQVEPGAFPDQCLAAAESVLASLRPFTAADLTATPTPSATLTPSPTATYPPTPTATP